MTMKVAVLNVSLERVTAEEERSDSVVTGMAAQLIYISIRVTPHNPSIYKVLKFHLTKFHIDFG